MNTIYTIGHSDHLPDRFVSMLETHGISVLYDVRTRPASRFEHFNKSIFKRLLEANGISYVFAGSALGGMPDDESFYEDGFCRYDRIAATNEFKKGIEEILALSETGKVVLCCGEGSPSTCHRRLMVGRVLRARGVEIVHILPDRSTITEQELQIRENDGQFSIFDDESRPWRSTRRLR